MIYGDVGRGSSPPRWKIGDADEERLKAVGYRLGRGLTSQP
jgi:hypothetical protein